MNFGKKLKKIRKMLNITQGQLAAAMEISQRTVSHYENGDSEPDLITVCRLAYAFNMSVEHLLAYDGNKDEGAYADLRKVTLTYLDKRRKYEEELRNKLENGRL